MCFRCSNTKFFMSRCAWLKNVSPVFSASSELIRSISRGSGIGNSSPSGTWRNCRWYVRIIYRTFLLPVISSFHGRRETEVTIVYVICKFLPNHWHCKWHCLSLLQPLIKGRRTGIPAYVRSARLVLIPDLTTKVWMISVSCSSGQGTLLWRDGELPTDVTEVRYLQNLRKQEAFLKYTGGYFKRLL